MCAPSSVLPLLLQDQQHKSSRAVELYEWSEVVRPEASFVEDPSQAGDTSPRGKPQETSIRSAATFCMATRAFLPCPDGNGVTAYHAYLVGWFGREKVARLQACHPMVCSLAFSLQDQEQVSWPSQFGRTCWQSGRFLRILFSSGTNFYYLAVAWAYGGLFMTLLIMISDSFLYYYYFHVIVSCQPEK